MHAAMDLTSLRICANSSEPSLVSYAISTKVLCSGSNEQAPTYRYVIKVLITHAQNCSLNAHEKISSGIRCLVCDLNIRQIYSIVCVKSKG